MRSTRPGYRRPWFASSAKASTTVRSAMCCAMPRGGPVCEVLCGLPLVEVPAQIAYDRVLRVTVVSFLDRFNFCLAGVKRSCIHFVTSDGRIIPFDTYNMFHRPGLAARPVRADA